YTLFTNSPLSASPARFTTLTPIPFPLPFITASIADGTVLISVNPSSSTSFSNSNALSPITTLPPLPSGANISNTDKSKLIDVVAPTDSNLSPYLSTPHLTNPLAFPCVIPTPFGSPV